MVAYFSNGLKLNHQLAESAGLGCFLQAKSYLSVSPNFEVAEISFEIFWENGEISDGQTSPWDLGWT